MFVSLAGTAAAPAIERIIPPSHTYTTLVALHPSHPSVHSLTHTRKENSENEKAMPYIVPEKRKRAMAIAIARNDEAENVVENDRLKTRRGARRCGQMTHSEVSRALQDGQGLEKQKGGMGNSR